MSDGQVRLWFRLLLAVPFVPVPQVGDAVTYITSQAPSVTGVEEFHKYFEATWMKGQYPLQMWNFFKCNGPRTNNYVEGSHIRMKKKVGRSHPNIFEVVSFFIQEEISSRVQLMH